MAREPKVKIERGSGNVFADLGLKNAKEHLAKAELVRAISTSIKEQNLTQDQAGKKMGLDQPKVCKLLQGNFSGYSLGRLYACLNSLGHDVTIRVKRRSKDSVGKTYVQVG